MNSAVKTRLEQAVDTPTGVSLVSVTDLSAALDTINTQAAEIERLRTALLLLCDSADAVMKCLADHGESAVAYLLDTDDNPGQWLRDSTASILSALEEEGDHDAAREGAVVETITARGD